MPPSIKLLPALFLTVIILATPADTPAGPASPPPANFARENLVAWAIVPYDARHRNATERARMIIELGMRRVAYDWRQEHIPAFEAEILAYKKYDIDYVAFWNEHPNAFALFEKYDLHPEIWKTNPSPAPRDPHMTHDARVSAAADQLLPLARKTRAMGCPLGLYNHGGWGGEPAHLVAVCEELRARGYEHTGIVYNFHHAHDLIAPGIEKFAEALELMKPYLLCLNLNGMTTADDIDPVTKQNKILPIGAGKHEAAMIRTILDSGYAGPIGIISHLKDQDAKKSLQDNLLGLESILQNTNPLPPAPPPN